MGRNQSKEKKFNRKIIGLVLIVIIIVMLALFLIIGFGHRLLNNQLNIANSSNATLEVRTKPGKQASTISEANTELLRLFPNPHENGYQDSYEADFDGDGQIDTAETMDGKIYVNFTDGTELICQDSMREKFGIQGADLNGDGRNEIIVMIDMGYNGGDGGYRMAVYDRVGDNYIEIPLPEYYRASEGFPYQRVWDGKELSLRINGVSLKIVDKELMQAIYGDSWSEKEWESIQGKSETIAVDALSGFTVVYAGTNGQAKLMVKQYIKGPYGGHASCIGYMITELVLRADNTWETNAFYSPAL